MFMLSAFVFWCDKRGKVYIFLLRKKTCVFFLFMKKLYGIENGVSAICELVIGEEADAIEFYAIRL